MNPIKNEVWQWQVCAKNRLAKPFGSGYLLGR